jgi:hypothetical protein
MLPAALAANKNSQHLILAKENGRENNLFRSFYIK